MSAVSSIMSFIDSDEDASAYFDLARDSFFVSLSEELGFNDATDLIQALEEDSLKMLWPVICEFFYSNVYGNNGKWNVVDKFLETAGGRRLSKKDKLYLKRSEGSIFSIYEIISVVKDKSITLKDIIRDTEAVTVSEKSATHFLKKGDYLGARIIDLDTHLELGGGILTFNHMDKSEIKSLVENILMMHEGVMQLTQLSLPEDQEFDADFVEHAAQTMWVTMIAEEWMGAQIKKQKHILSNLRNKSGHLIQSIRLAFPILTDVNRAFIRALEKHKQIEPDHNEFQWLWLDRKSKKEDSSPILGQIILEDNMLVAYLNSQERANMLEDILEKLLKGKIGKAVQSIAQSESGSIDAFSDFAGALPEAHQEEDDELSPEEVNNIINSYKKQHYTEWLKSRIPALGNKTPRMAKRSKQGKIDLINLLVEIEQNEKLQTEPDMAPFDMTWMWEELGLERPEDE